MCLSARENKICVPREGDNGGSALVNKGEGKGRAVGRDEDATDGGCRRKGMSCGRFGGVDAIFYCPSPDRAASEGHQEKL